MRPSTSLLAVLLVGLFALPVAALAAPSPTIAGLVATRDDGLPLPGATVAIESLALSVTTDATGRYLLTLPADQVGKQVELKVMAPGVASSGESRYGEYCAIEDLPSPTATAQVFEAEWLTDLELTWRDRRFQLGAGVHNLFNTLPDTQIAGTAFNNIRTFPRNAPFFNGRYLYAKATLRF